MINGITNGTPPPKRRRTTKEPPTPTCNVSEDASVQPLIKLPYLCFECGIQECTYIYQRRSSIRRRRSCKYNIDKRKALACQSRQAANRKALVSNPSPTTKSHQAIDNKLESNLESLPSANPSNQLHRPINNDNKMLDYSVSDCIYEMTPRFEEKNDNSSSYAFFLREHFYRANINSRTRRDELKKFQERIKQCSEYRNHAEDLNIIQKQLMEHIKINKNDINMNILEFGKKRCDLYLRVTGRCGTGGTFGTQAKKQKNQNDSKANPITTKTNKSDVVEKGKNIQFKCKCCKLIWYNDSVECKAFLHDCCVDLVLLSPFFNNSNWICSQCIHETVCVLWPKILKAQSTDNFNYHSLNYYEKIRNIMKLHQRKAETKSNTNINSTGNCFPFMIRYFNEFDSKWYIGKINSIIDINNLRVEIEHCNVMDSTIEHSKQYHRLQLTKMPMFMIHFFRPRFDVSSGVRVATKTATGDNKSMIVSESKQNDIIGSVNSTRNIRHTPLVTYNDNQFYIDRNCCVRECDILDSNGYIKDTTLILITVEHGSGSNALMPNLVNVSQIKHTFEFYKYFSNKIINGENSKMFDKYCKRVNATINKIPKQPIQYITDATGCLKNSYQFNGRKYLYNIVIDFARQMCVFPHTIRPDVDAMCQDRNGLVNKQPFCKWHITEKIDFFNKEFRDKRLWIERVIWCNPPYIEKTINEVCKYWIKDEKRGYLMIPRCFAHCVNDIQLSGCLKARYHFAKDCKDLFLVNYSGNKGYDDIVDVYFIDCRTRTSPHPAEKPVSLAKKIDKIRGLSY